MIIVTIILALQFKTEYTEIITSAETTGRDEMRKKTNLEIF